MTWSQFLASHGWLLPVMLILLACSGFLSASETALFKLSAGQLYRMRTSGGRLRHLVASLMATPRRVLNTVLLSNLVVNVAFASISATAILDLERSGLLGPAGAAAAAMVPLLILILVGEVIPKSLAFAAGVGVAEAAALPLSLLVRLLSPLISVLETVLVNPLTRAFAPRRHGGQITSEELAALLDLSVKRGIIGHDANELLQEVIELTELKAGDVMVPRVDVVAFDINDPPETLHEIFRTSRLRRVPVYDGDMDKTLGMVHAKKFLLEPTRPVRELVQPLPFVPQAANLEKVLLQLRVMRTQIALVVDEFGGTAGLLTLEDVLEEIVGEIPDEHTYQKGPGVNRVSDREYILEGDLAIHEWADAFTIDLSAGRISTIGGFVTSLLGRIPRMGDVARYRNLRFTVLSMKHRRIDKVRLELLEAKR